MSTSSKYSNNKLKEVINNGTCHIVIKSYITTAFEFHRKKSEYHLYWHNANAGLDPETLKYKCLSSKKMGRSEVRYFYSIIDQYLAEIDGDDGSVWVNKSIGFNKSHVKVFQMSMEFK